MIAKERIKTLNERNIADQPYVVYWMQSAQRAECNHALEYSVQQANALYKPLIVYFGITQDFPEANERHYRFMLEGLRETKAELSKRKIKMVIRKISPETGALEFSSVAAMMIVDRGYLRIEKSWRDFLAYNAACPVVQVETNVLVPTETASSKEEYSAATFRPKINRMLNTFALPLEEQGVSLHSINLHLPYEESDIEDIDAALNRFQVDRSVKPVTGFTGGTSQARMHLNDFILNKLKKYPKLKNDPGLDYSSNLSPYLHFGQIAPLYIYQRLEEFPEVSRSEFIEELVIRRELSINFAQYNDRYDTYDSLPAWAKETLDKHRRDHRPYQYSLNDMEEARTHDLYWNTAQTEMILTGKMNGYMRMYWGKKILEWMTTPEEAYQAAVRLNNKYNLDGRDPNGFAGVAWCFGKHDRPWIEREIFGTVRYMNAKGLDRKFNMMRYVEKVRRLGLYPGKGQDDGE